MSVEANRQQIRENRRAIFELENDVHRNRAAAYGTRAIITENASLIRKNYDAAFSGNRQLINFNTDAAFRNRQAAVRNIPATTDVETNYREAMTNRVKLEWLQHRSKLNERVIRVSKRFAEANRQLIDLNKDIMDTNEELVNFNKKLIESNAAAINGGWNSKGATPESNRLLIEENSRQIAEIRSRIEGNKRRGDEVRAAALANRESILKNSESIMKRRAEIEANAAKIAENQSKVGAFIARL